MVTSVNATRVEAFQNTGGSLISAMANIGNNDGARRNGQDVQVSSALLGNQTVGNIASLVEVTRRGENQQHTESEK